jgi:GWxTD domain-containing protein
MLRSLSFVTLWFLIGLVWDGAPCGADNPLGTNTQAKEEAPTFSTALAAIEKGDYQKSLDLALLLQSAHTGEPRYLGLVGQAYAALGDADAAMSVFRDYKEALPESEWLLYEDLSLVATGREIAAIESASPKDREILLQAFWARRDLTDTRGWGRKVEHYRRVWYARIFFAESDYPWDTRGEVYIRYGEPDYRARSNRANPIPNLAVEAIKRKNAYWIYETGVDREAGVNTAYIDPAMEVNPDLDNPFFRLRDVSEWSYVEVRDDEYYWAKPRDVELERWQEPTFPIERGPGGGTRVPWESWVYTNVGNGLEIAFVDDAMNGGYDFPSMPDTKFPPPLGLVTNLASNHPGAVYQTQAAEFPDFYDLAPGVEPLSFYYNAATFRGTSDETSLEIYLGISPNEVATHDIGGRPVIQVECAVTLKGAGEEQSYRTDEHLALAVKDPSEGNRGGFIPNAASMIVVPGTYRLAVRIRDKVSGKVGIYLQELEIPAYGDSLSLSDLEMAWKVTEKRWDDKYRKGDVWVIPMPGRSYQFNQKVYVYYEVYNLLQDNFGATRYQVEYSVRRSSRGGSGALSAVASGVRRLFSQKRPVVTVSYERAGTEPSEDIYLDLDPKKLGSGLFELEVVVTDLSRDSVVSKKTLFRIEEEMKRGM